MNSFESGLLHAQQLDAVDPLRPYRDRFYLQPDTYYMDGNSHGLLSKDAEAAVLQSLDDWKRLAVEGWTTAQRPWFHLPETLGAWTAPLVGAHPHEVVVTGTATTNLHTLLATFYRPRGTRTKILADDDNFPSDLYALHSHLRLHHRPDTDLVRLSTDHAGHIDESRLIAAMSPDVALVLLPSVWYKSGQLANLERLTAAAHERGILIGFDCCHSIGVVPHALHDWGVDFAVWCNYKYLNAGPGATAGLYVHERHHHEAPGLAGWFGTAKEHQFDMGFPQEPAPSAGRWQISTPPVLATVAGGASLQMIAEVGIAAIREKSLRQTAFLRTQIEQRILTAGLGGAIVTPEAADCRGGHIAFAHPHAVQISQALKARNVIPDYRPPNIVRLAPIPLYTSFEDICHTVDILRDILADKTYERFGPNRNIVS